MELSAGTLVFLTVISLTILVSSLLGRESNSNRRRPPGPRCLPFIGGLHHLLTSQPQAALRDLAKRHGPVMYLQLGQLDAVVISSPAAAQEVLTDNTLTFASRPSILGTDISSYGNLDIAFSPYGAYWRTLRRLCTVELLSARKVRQFAAVMNSETLSLVRGVREAGCAGGGGKPVDLGRLVLRCANTITAKATFGQGCCEAELRERFLSAMQQMLNLSGRLFIGDLFPFLRFVDVLTGVKARLWRVHRQLDAIFEEIIQGCEARRETTQADDQDDFLSVMLRIKDQGELEIPIGRTNIKAVIVDMFTAGTETTSLSVEWIMSQLMRNPEVMAKAQAEVRRTLDNKSPQDHDAFMEKLHYTKMVIKEALRLHPPAPLLLPRVCRETCDVGGFQVAAGSRVIVNAWAIGRSPEHWSDDADEFRPERFNYSSAPDYNGTQYKYLSFGTGRRICPGVNFGMAMVELIVARLLYYFDWGLPTGILPHELDMDMIVNMTARRKTQLLLTATLYEVPSMENPTSSDLE